MVEINRTIVDRIIPEAVGTAKGVAITSAVVREANCAGADRDSKLICGSGRSKHAAANQHGCGHGRFEWRSHAWTNFSHREVVLPGLIWWCRPLRASEAC